MLTCRVSSSVSSLHDQLAGSPGSLSSPDPQSSTWSLTASVPHLIFPSCLLHEHLLPPHPHPQGQARGQRWGLTMYVPGARQGWAQGLWGWGAYKICVWAVLLFRSGRTIWRGKRSETKGSESCDKSGCPDLALSLQEWARGALNIAVSPEGLAGHQ